MCICICICTYICICACICICRCGEDFYWLRRFNAEINESAVGEKQKKNVRVGPWALVRALVGPLCPYGPGPYGLRWALMGRALTGLPGPL